jgi:ligand-binding sensor domain-containing protein
MGWFTRLLGGRRPRLAIATGLVALGIAIEFAQGATGYRSFDAWDMVADGLGVAVGPDGTIWVLGQTGALSAWRQGPTGWVVEHHADLQQVGPPTPWMGVQGDGNVWVNLGGYFTTFARFDGESWTKPLDSSIAGRPISDVLGAAIDADGHVWALWWRAEDGPVFSPVFGPARLDDSGWTVVSEAGTGAYLNGLVADLDGSPWMGSEDGLLRWDGTLWTPAGLGGVSVTPMYVSDDGAVWFTSWFGSLYRLPAEATAP